jgi:ubiquinone/menaquinone biosynthesis C-methylase UbiE
MNDRDVSVPDAFRHIVKSKESVMKDAGYYKKLYNEKSGYWDSVYKVDECELSIYAMHFLQRRNIIWQMISRLPKHESMTALDAGCGPGAYLQILLSEKYEVDALDPAEEMLERARANVPVGLEQSVHFHHGEVQSLRFKDATFDLVLSVGVIMYIEDDVKAVQELCRVLKPGGTLIMVVDNKRNLADLIDIPARARNFFKKILGYFLRHRSLGHTAEFGYSRTYSPHEIKSLLRQNGLEIEAEASTGINPLLFNGKRIFTNRIDVRLEKVFQGLTKLPGLKRTGYIYVCTGHRPAHN